MHYFVLAGSHRPQAQTTKVASYISHQITSQLGSTSYIYDLRNNPLPLWNDWRRDSESEQNQQFMQTRGPISEELEKADAIVMITPEWEGMATPGIKNFLLYVGKELANKPALLVSVSAGRGGRYPITEMRGYSYKNVQVCYIPQHVIVDHVGTVLNDMEPSSEDKADGYFKEKIQYSLRMLEQYAKGLKLVRESGVVDLEKHPHGM